MPAPLTCPVDGRRAAFTLVDLLLAIILGGIVCAIIVRATSGGQRFYDAIVRRIDARAAGRDVGSVLPSALRDASAAGGDLIALSDSAIEIRATLGSAVICATDPTGTRAWLTPTQLASGGTLAAFLDPPRAGDLALVYDPGAVRGNADDRWLVDPANTVGTSVTACPTSPFVDSLLDRGKPRTVLDLAVPLPPSARAGATVRLTRRLRYRFYLSQSRWWLGYADWNGMAWSTVQPVSGPFRPYGPPGTSGLAFHYYNDAGSELPSPVSRPDSVARVDIVVRPLAPATRIPGSTISTVAESLLVTIALRNRK